MIKLEKIIYQIKGRPYEGVISWEHNNSARRPGILIAPTFRGQSDFEVQKSIELAKLGYLAFAIDLYGQGRRAANAEEAGVLMGELNDNRPLLKARITQTLIELRNHPKVNAAKIAAIGFCFGGKCVLDLARSGADIAGVVSFHGIYDAPDPAEVDPIKASVLVLHGWDDPLAPPGAATALGHELTQRQADWQILAFGHTGHAFTNPGIHNKNAGMFYQASADRRSWQAMQNFLDEIFQ